MSDAQRRFLESFGIGVVDNRVVAIRYVAETSYTTSDDLAAFSFSKLQEAYDYLKSISPIIVRLWFVDNAREYHMIMNAFAQLQRDYPPPPGVLRFGSIYDIEIVRFFKHAMRSGEGIQNRDEPRAYSSPDQITWPWWCDHPGAWAEWSDETVSAVTFGESKATPVPNASLHEIMAAQEKLERWREIFSNKE